MLKIGLCLDTKHTMYHKKKNNCKSSSSHKSNKYSMARQRLESVFKVNLNKYEI